MLSAVTDAIATVISWIGTVIQALVGTATTANPEYGAFSALLPLFAIGIAISAVLLGVKLIKSVVWGS